MISFDYVLIWALGRQQAAAVGGRRRAGVCLASGVFLFPVLVESALTMPVPKSHRDRSQVRNRRPTDTVARNAMHICTQTDAKRKCEMCEMCKTQTKKNISKYGVNRGDVS